MQFSMIFEAQMSDPTRLHEQEVIRSCVEQAVYAEEMSFDRVWAVEHHTLYWYAHMSAPEIFLSAVAARTSRIRLGHGVVCMPFNYNHPARVAERAAMLDIVSNGRLDLGAGKGGTVQEMSLCGVDPERATAEVREALQIIGKVWLEDEFEWHGDLLDIESPAGSPKHRVVPRPVQTPHPPLFLACSHPETVKTAAEYGVGALAFGFAGPDSIRNIRKMYHDTMASRSGQNFVSTVVNDHLAALCPSVVLDDRDEAIQIGARGQRFFGESITHWARIGSPPPSETTEYEDNVSYMHEMKTNIYNAALRGELPGYMSDPSLAGATFNIEHAYGNTADAIAYVEELDDIGVDEVMCMIQMGTVPLKTCMETIRHWGEEVIPRFRM